MSVVGLQNLCLQLLKVLVNEDKERNIFYSPLSIMSAFSMLLMGSRNKSAQQLVDSLHLNNISLDNIHEEIGKLLNQCSKPLGSYDESKLLIANGFFCQKDYKVEANFQSGLVNHYKSEIKEVNFSDASTSAKIINQWIEAKTNNKIRDMFSDSSFNDLTRLVLANAIYFKDNFKDAFPEDRTTKKPFHKSAQEHEEVDMMATRGDYKYAEDNITGIKMLVVPFKNFNYKLLLILPMKRFGLSETVDKFNASTICDLVRATGLRMVSNLEVPKFKLNTEMDLKKIMPLLGVKDVFDPQAADLSGISAGGLFVGEAVHKTFLDLNENGVEAAAATAMSIGLMCAPMFADQTPIEFVVDEPFLLAVYHSAADAVIFFGKFNSP